MSKPRFSIIPAAAVTDRSLKPRDLQVLCLLGRHTDHAGWCIRRQTTMAEELDCSRGSLQSSLDRLCEAGYVERRRRDTAVAEAGKHPSLAYAYRVLLDRGDFAFDDGIPEIGDDDIASYAESASEEGGCQPAGTPRANPELAPRANPGLAPRANPYVGTNNDPLERSPVEREDGSDARARPQPFTDGSKTLAAAFWRAVGIERPLDIPPELAGVDYRAVMWERAGWTVDLIDAEARRLARDRPLKPLSYFEKVFATAFAKRQAPLPSAEVRQSQTVNSHARPGNNLIPAADRLVDKLRSFDAGPGRPDGLRGRTGAAPPRLLPEG